MDVGERSGVPAVSVHVDHQGGSLTASFLCASKSQAAPGTLALVPRVSGQGSLLTCYDGHSHGRRYWFSGEGKKRQA